jgi:hypothetical protein
MGGSGERRAQVRAARLDLVKLDSAGASVRVITVVSKLVALLLAVRSSGTGVGAGHKLCYVSCSLVFGEAL